MPLSITDLFFEGETVPIETGLLSTDGEINVSPISHLIVARGLALLLYQFQGTVYLKHLVQAFLEQIEEIANRLDAVVLCYNYLTATGKTLVTIGENLGVKNYWAYDYNTLRDQIKVRVSQINSCGTLEDLYNTIMLLINPTQMAFFEYDASVKVQISNIGNAIVLTDAMVEVLGSIVPAGVSLSIDIVPIDMDYFGFDEDTNVHCFGFAEEGHTPVLPQKAGSLTENILRG
jgi:hypothetical protein